MKTVLALIFMLVSLFGYGQCTCTTTGASTNWNAAAAWSCVGTGCASTPRTGWPYDDVVINHNITRTGNLAFVDDGDVTVNSPATMTVTGNLTINSYGTSELIINNGATVTVGGMMRLYALENYGTINANRLDLQDGTQTSSGGEINVTNDFEIGNSGVMFTSSGTDINVGTDFDFTGSGGADISGGMVDVNGSFSYNGSTNTKISSDLDVAGDMDLLAGANLTLGGDVTIHGEFNKVGGSGLVVQGDMEVIGDMSIANGSPANDVLVENGAKLTVPNFYATGANDVTINGEMDVSAGEIDLTTSAQIDGNGIVSFDTLFTDNSGSAVTCITGDKHDNTATTPLIPYPIGSPFDLNACGIPLPVEYLYINADVTEDGVLISWATAMEKQNDFFVILKSYDGISYHNTGIVGGAGTSTDAIHYTFLDNETEGEIYYRIKQVDFDGGNKTSNIVSVSMEYRSAIYPTKIENTLNVTHVSDSYSVHIYNVTGHLIGVYDVDEIDLTSCPPGVYMVILYDGKIMLEERVLKSH